MTAGIELLTIGHSTHPWERFSALLRGAGVTAIADVRSSPYSRRTPHFSRDELAGRLRQSGFAYVFLGGELGGRPGHPALFSRGVADYEKMAATPGFAAGLDRVVAGARRYRIALMCAERDPLDCHRCLLVARRLAERGAGIGHILADGDIASHGAIEERLLALSGVADEDLFATPADRLAAAYRLRNGLAAFAAAPSVAT